MKIRIMSDIHFTDGINGCLNPNHSAFNSYFGKMLKHDNDCVTLIAGDMATGLDYTESFLKYFFPNEQVIFIEGNHCLTGNTEVLTENGFKNIKEITLEDRVYQYNNGYCELVHPERIVHNIVDKVYNFKAQYFNQSVSDNHRMIMSNGNVTLAKDLIDKKLDQTSFVLTSNTKDDIDYDIDDNLLRLLVWTVADGTIILKDTTLKKYTYEELEEYKINPTKTRIQFHISKDRKITSLSNLLDKMNYKYTFAECKKVGINKLQPYYIRIYSDFAREIVKLLEYKKEFPSWFLKLSKRQLDIVLETLAETDGSYCINPKTKKSLDYHIHWVHISKNDTDILQHLCLRKGYIFKYEIKEKNKSTFKSNKEIYQCDIYKKVMDYGRKNGSVKITEKNGNVDVYCLTVPSGAFLIRVDGTTSITGNCVYVKGHKTIYELQDELRDAYPKNHLLYHYLENDWMFLPNSNDSVAVIGSTFFTDYEYTTLTVDSYNERQQKYANAIKAFGYGDDKYEPIKELTTDLIIKENMLTAEESLNDFRWGWETPTRHISPNLYLELHNKAKLEIKRCYDEIMEINPNCKVLLMTHHCLSPKCIDKKYANHKANASYVSDLEDWVNSFDNIKLVISGHVHCRKDFKFGNDKRMILNPVGYINYHEPWDEPKFNPNFIIDTDDL